METLKKYLLNLDVILVLTAISYAVVYCYNVGAAWYYDLPIRYIELGVNNLTDTLLVLCFFIIIYVPMVLDIQNFTTKNLFGIAAFLFIYCVYMVLTEKTIPSITIVLIGCIIIFIFKKYLAKSVLIVVVTLYVLISSIFLGYSIRYNLYVEGSEQFTFVNDGKTYVIVGYYSDYYISSKLDTKTNAFFPEYQLFPLDSEVEDEPIIIKKSKDKIKFKRT